MRHPACAGTLRAMSTKELPMQVARTARSPSLTTRPRARRALIAMNGVMALNAFGGAWYALGGAPNVPTEWLAGTPFSDYVVPGLILGGVVGAGQLVAAVALRLRHPRAREVSLAASLVLLGWIVTQLAMIGYVSVLQPIVLTWALVAGALAQGLAPDER
jgi:hypothetical protein